MPGLGPAWEGWEVLVHRPRLRRLSPTRSLGRQHLPHDRAVVRDTPGPTFFLHSLQAGQSQESSQTLVFNESGSLVCLLMPSRLKEGMRRKR